METFEDIRKCWHEKVVSDTSTDPLSKDSVERMIKSRVRKQKTIVLQYFWASFTYQILIYAFASHLIIKFWGDSQVLLLCLGVVLLYIPFTAILMKRFKAMYPSATDKADSSVQNIGANVKKHHARLMEFFRFKKRFEWLAVPLSCFVMIMMVFKIYVNGGIQEHLTSGIISFLALLTCFVVAIYFENRKHFTEPLKQLELILKDIDKDLDNH